MRQDKKEWFKNAKIRLAATVVGVISVAIATGLIFDLRTAAVVFAAEVVACWAYSLRKLHKERKESGTDGD